MGISVRLALAQEISAVMKLVSRVVPGMRASGNLQWDSVYPNTAVFHRDVELGQLWVAEIEEEAEGGEERQQNGAGQHGDEGQIGGPTFSRSGRISGVAAITTDQSPEYADAGWDIAEAAIVVHRLAVDPDAQGKGIAAALMLQAERVARTRGISCLRVDTNTHNEATQMLFPKLGYSLSGEIGLAMRPGLRFLCYEKRLS